MGDHPLQRETCSMPRTRRQATLVNHVQTAMSRRDERRTAPPDKASGARWHEHSESEQTARWENEGGAVVHTAGQLSRPLS
jgi:hypothetical protein